MSKSAIMNKFKSPGVFTTEIDGGTYYDPEYAKNQVFLLDYFCKKNNLDIHKVAEHLSSEESTKALIRELEIKDLTNETNNKNT